MAINTYLSTIKSKKQTSGTETDSYIQRTFWQLPDGKEVGGMGKKGKGIKKYKLDVTEQSWWCKVQHREYSQ